ncbi:peptide-methionine (S)-S-oxide reductase MsrA [Candidatus Uhrbacteria bacterium]|nr:peptide-methionine (S)-S-oxide reductase MsrA [Candidatus Uhrbacteria bacterium]
MSTKSAVFGGGCFWCTEAIFKNLNGVSAVSSGYAGGDVPNPTYEQVSTGETGHAEVIKIDYNPDVLPYEKLLDVFFHTHDPTQLNRQGHDVGTQYRSLVLFMDDDQREAVEKYIAELNSAKEFDKPIVTEVKRFEKFYSAEDYHKDYYENHKENPYCELVISPKLAEFWKRYKDLAK